MIETMAERFEDMASELVPRSLGDLGRLLAAVMACEAAGGVGAIATAGSVDTWYRTLDKPSFTPPSWLFGPVWTALYGLMGIALSVVWRLHAQGRETGAALGWFGAQLALNVLWSFLFFRFRSPRAALIEIVVLWIAVAMTVAALLRVSRLAALLMLPYLLWTSFAAALNFGIWRQNRG